MTNCPKCLGTGEIFIHSKLKECNLCKGEKKVDDELAEDFINSLKVFDEDDYE